MTQIDEVTNINHPLVANVDNTEFVGGAGYRIAPGPALKPESLDVGTLEVIGLLQTVNIASSKTITQVGEIGTHSKYLTTFRGVKSLSFSRLMTNHRNSLYALYSYLIGLHDGTHSGYDKWEKGKDYPRGPIWKNLEHSLFKKSIGLYALYIDENNETQGQIYFENVLIEDLGDASVQGNKGVIETITLKWANTKYLPA